VPKAFGQKYMELDHDSDVRLLAPPVQNTWYEVFRAYDVRLLWCAIKQTNTETNAKFLEARFTIDGNVYLGGVNATNDTLYYVYRYHTPSTGGTLGLAIVSAEYNAGRNVDKRGHDFKVEVRITSALGTNQTLLCNCVRETLELT